MKKTSQSTVRRVVQYWLERPPEIIGDYCSVKYIICDGSLLNRRTGIYAIMNSENHQINKCSLWCSGRSKGSAEVLSAIKISWLRAIECHCRR